MAGANVKFFGRRKMMKNILTVLTVLAMASVANASLLISVNGVVDPPETEIWLAPSDHLVIDIWGNGMTPPPQGMYLASSKESGGMILDSTNIEILYPGGLSMFYQVEDPGEFDYISSLIGDAPVCSAIYIALVDPHIPPAPLDGKLVDGIDLHCAGLEGDGVLYLVEQERVAIFDTQVIHQIPEPATVLLLGLGGLALLRKRN